MGRPFLADAHQPALGDLGQDDFLRETADAKAVKCRLKLIEDDVEDKLALDGDLYLAAVFLELPRP